MSVCRMDDSPWCVEGTCVDCDEARNPRCPCDKHPKYKAKAQPRVACEPCWRYFMRVNP